MTYRGFEDLARRTASDNILCDKAFDIDGYQRGLASMVYRVLIKKLLVVVLEMKICQTSNQLKNYTNQLSENFKKEKYTCILV